MTSQAQKSALASAANGVDYIGIAQPSAVAISSPFSRNLTPRRDKVVLNRTAHGLRVGTPIRIAGSTNYNGLTRVLRVINANSFVINRNWVAADAAGNYSVDGGEGAWLAFRPLGADLPGANVAITFWDDSLNTGATNVVAYQRDFLYNFPGIIKTIQITTAGNVQLYRNPTLRPWGKDAL